MMWRALVIVLCVSASVILAAPTEDASALSKCTSIEIVAARGSGQQYGHSPELQAVRNLLPAQYIYSELENTIPQLSNEPKYLAIEVSKDGRPTLDAGVAFFSRSTAGLYRTSVDSGKNLLKKYITNSIAPTDKCLVLVGYSQGAQVVNETMRDMYEADPDSLKNVIYIGLFGDPLYSPYGFDDSREPSWLRGDALYPFYGALFKDVSLPGKQAPDYIPRNPSNPKAPFTKVGSWCNYGDVICATNVTHYAAMRDGHGTYTGYECRGYG